jgi:hypothetical protein
MSRALLGRLPFAEIAKRGSRLWRNWIMSIARPKVKLSRERRLDGEATG